MTQPLRVVLLLFAGSVWAAAFLADRHGLPYVEFALAVSGIASAVLSLLPDKP